MLHCALPLPMSVQFSQTELRLRDILLEYCLLALLPCSLPITTISALKQIKQLGD